MPIQWPCQILGIAEDEAVNVEEVVDEVVVAVVAVAAAVAVAEAAAVAVAVAAVAVAAEAVANTLTTDKCEYTVSI